MLQYVPFIQGPRNCLGQYFALLEARIVLALLVKVRLRLRGGQAPLHASNTRILMRVLCVWLPAALRLPVRLQQPAGPPPQRHPGGAAEGHGDAGHMTSAASFVQSDWAHECGAIVRAREEV